MVISASHYGSMLRTWPQTRRLYEEFIDWLGEQGVTRWPTFAEWIAEQ